jgi:hypothetical protein
MSTIESTGGVNAAMASAVGIGRGSDVEKAARQFEAIFVQQLLQSMRRTIPESASMGRSAGSSMYDFMLDRSVADQMSAGRGIGIADFLHRQWTGDQIPSQNPVAAGTPINGGSIPAISGQSPDFGVSLEVFEQPSSGEGWDDGSRPLRDALPPTGLEKDHFFLNNSGTSFVNSSENLPSFEVSHGSEVRAPDVNDPSTIARGGSRGSTPDRIGEGRDHAIASYQRTARDSANRHGRNVSDRVGGQS